MPEEQMTAEQFWEANNLSTYDAMIAFAKYIGEQQVKAIDENLEKFNKGELPSTFDPIHDSFDLTQIK